MSYNAIMWWNYYIYVRNEYEIQWKLKQKQLIWQRQHKDKFTVILEHLYHNVKGITAMYTFKMIVVDIFIL